MGGEVREKECEFMTRMKADRGPGQSACHKPQMFISFRLLMPSGTVQPNYSRVLCLYLVSVSRD